MSDRPLRAWLYLRVSNDPTGRGLSVGSQETELRDWAAREGWSIVGVTTDNDRSASRRAKKTRPGYREIHARMAQGAMDVLACWESSRAQRDLAAYIQTRDLCEEQGVLFAYKGRLYDLSRTDDRFSTGLDALLDERYADEVHDRVMRGMRTRLAKGTPHGKIPFGYRREYDPTTGAVLRQVPDPVTAPIVQEMFARLDAGEAIYAIAQDFNRRKLPTPQAYRDARRQVDATRGGWTSSKIRRQVTNRALAGYRMHKGKLVGDAPWDPIVPADQFAAVNERLTDPSRRTQRGVAPKHLLSGILECGICGARCRRIANGGHPAYACHGHDFNNKACVCGRQQPLDALVTEAVLRRLASPDFVTAFTGTRDNDDLAQARRDLRALEERLEEFQRSADDPDGISPAALARAEARYVPLIEAARRRATPVWVPQAVVELSRGDVTEKWNRLTLDAQRDVIRALMRVTLMKDARPRGSRGFDFSRVRIDWA